MNEITELTILTRVTAELPDGVSIATDIFPEGWNQLLSGNLNWMDREIRTAGWHFIMITEPSVKSGVGATAQSAIAGAVKLALRQVRPGFNAASVDHIAVTQFPWFFLARVRVYPYQIQLGTTLAMDTLGTELRRPVAKRLIPVATTLAGAAGPASFTEN
jgi:hypothetical protein